MSLESHDARFSTTESAGEDGDKETQKDALIRHGSQAKLWHDPDQQAFASFSIKGHTENHPLRSKPFKSWIRWQFYRETQKAPGSQAIEDALSILEAKAVFDGDERQTFLRLAGVDDRVYMDIGDENWRAIEVSGAGWKVISDPSVAFIRSRGMRPLPCPDRGGSIQDLKELVNLKSDDDFKLFVAWLLSTLRPAGPFPILCLNGEQGSAKTTLARIARRLIDPNAADTRTIPKDETDLLIAARNGWIINLDNVSQIRDWLSDALCRVSTGGGFGTRQLYTNTDEVLFEAKRPIIINGIPTLATRPDLGDRCLVFILPSISKRSRMPESTFWERFEERAGGILGVLLDCAVQALRGEAAVRDFALEHEVELPRMADAALWVEAGVPALGWSPGVLLKLFLDNQAEVQKHIVDADLVAQAVQRLMEERAEWEGNSTELLGALVSVTLEDTRRHKEYPKSARGLSNRLRLASPGLRMTGVGIDSRILDGKTIWTLHKTSGGKHPTLPTYPTSDDPSGQSGQSGQDSGQSLTKTPPPDPEDLEHDAVERLANQTEPEADPDDPSTHLDDSDFHLSPETREANRLLGEFPPQFDRRRKASVRT